MDLLLIGCGFVSAIPQLGLSLGIRSVPMISLGIMQYLLPTTVFLLGAFVMQRTHIGEQAAGVPVHLGGGWVLPVRYRLFYRKKKAPAGNGSRAGEVLRNEGIKP